MKINEEEMKEYAEESKKAIAVLMECMEVNNIPVRSVISSLIFILSFTFQSSNVPFSKAKKSLIELLDHYKW